MGKKVKVVYDVERKEAKKKNKRNRKKSPKVVPWIIFVLCEALYYYLVTPPINIQSTGFWMWLIISLLIVIVLIPDYSLYDMKNFKVGKFFKTEKLTKILFGAVLVMVGVVFLGGIISSKLFMASRYANLIDIQNGEFSVDIVENDNINDIALMDTDSARIIGDRAIGSLSDVVSQYEVSQDYSTIDYNGKPMKVASLEYAGLIKFFNNQKDGIPGYVLVDPVKNEAKYVKLDKAIKYSSSAYFNSNLRRHVQLAYPTKIFGGYYLELDNEGNPYYICPTLKSNAGLFGAKDVKGVVICDPCTGDTEYYDVADVPSWVDRVYDGELACTKYDWYGTLSGGFWNSVFGNKGCKKTTDDYGYKVMNGDVWVYTGVTSVNGDESNIGFIMSNLRTAETKYYEIAGAEEYSAMSSAEGQVQNLGYKASFPSLINIQGIPTYIMVLKDNAGLVKMYALVNVEKYNIVATGTTQKEALNAYKKLLASNGISVNVTPDDESTPSLDIKVTDIKYIVMDGETYVYITDEKGNVYKQAFADDETLIFIQTEDKIKVYYNEGENGLRDLIRYEHK